MPWVSGGLNAIAIFAATSCVVFYFDLSLLWYSAALLAWIMRWQSLYQARSRAAKLAEPAADQTAENL